MLKKIIGWFRRKEHQHRFPRWEYMDRVPSVRGSSTGFATAFCNQDGCDCAAVLPLENLTENASPEFREEFLEGLKKVGRRLLD